MRQHRYECPECGSHETTQVHRESFAGMIESVRICDNCPVQFTNKFFLEDVEVERPEDWEAPDETAE